MPAPTGPHRVGTAIFEWTDSLRRETAAADSSERRFLRVQLWYPASPPPAADDGLRPAPLFPEIDAFRAAYPENFPARFENLVAHSRLDAPIRADGPPLPLIVFFHGWNSQRSAYTGLLEELASQGFVVAGVDQPYAGRIAMPGGSVTVSRDDQFGGPEAMLAYYRADYEFVVEHLAEVAAADPRFRNRIRTDRPGTLGHSNGAVTAVVAARADDRVRGVALLDSFGADVEPIFRVSQPLLLVRTGGAEAPSAAYLAETSNPLYDVTVAGGDHLTASDWPLVRAATDSLRAAAAAAALALRRTVTAFFDRTLRNRDAPLPAVEDASAGRATLEMYRP